MKISDFRPVKHSSRFPSLSSAKVSKSKRKYTSISRQENTGGREMKISIVKTKAIDFFGLLAKKLGKLSPEQPFWVRVVTLVFLVSIFSGFFMIFMNGQASALTRESFNEYASSIDYGTGSYTTGSFTPADNSLLIVWVGGMEWNGTSDVASCLTISDSESSTWSLELSQANTNSWAIGSKVWTTEINTGTSMTVTVDCGSTSIYAYAVHVAVYTGYDTNDPIGATVKDTSSSESGSYTINLSSAPASTSDILGTIFCDSDGTHTVTEGTGWTELAETSNSGHNILNTETKNNTTSTSITWNDVIDQAGSIKLIGFGIEVKASASPSLSPPLLTQEGYVFENDDGNWGGSTAAEWYNSSWTYRKKITIGSTDENLTNFPVYVDLGDLGSDFHSNVKSDGGDIRITKSDGKTEVAREIVAINTGSETGELYFKADSLSSSSNTEFYIYYDNSGASDYAIDATYGAENVWSNGYVGVWHLGGDLLDSTSNDNDGSGSGNANGTGKFGDGEVFDDGVNDYVDVGGGSSLTAIDGALTMEAWVNHVSSSSSSWKRIVSSSLNFTTNNDGFGITYTPSDDLFRAGYGAGDSNSQITYQDDTTLGETAWYSVAMTVSGSTLSTYVDGISNTHSTEDASYVTLDSGSSVRIGNRLSGATGTAWGGTIDEVRISDTPRSSGWLSSQYTNQNTPTSFYSIGSQETESTGGSLPGENWYNENWTYRKSITVQSSYVDENVTDFPVYVDLNDMGSDFHNNVKSDGGDIRVTKSNGITEVPIELVAIDTGAADSGELYFKADSLSSGSNTIFYIYYGNSGATGYTNTATYGAENVWTNSYVSVWHLNEDCADDDTGCVKDSVGNNDLTSKNFSTGGDNSVAGKIGNADDFDGTDSYHSMSSDASQTVGTTYSVSAWVNTDSSADQGVFSSTNGTHLHLRLDSDDDLHLLAYEANSGSWPTYDQQSSDTGSRITTSGGWQLYSVSVNGTDGNIYYNGTEVSSYSQTIGDTKTDNSASSIGGIGLYRDYGTPDNVIDGQLDEVRFSDDTWSDGWISTQYNNQDSPSTFYSVGSQSTDTGGETGADSTILAGSEFSSGKTLTDVRQGERFNLRVQLTNSGGALSSSDELALFYDRNDGIWSRVKSLSDLDVSTGDCDTDTNFGCDTIAATGDVGEVMDVAIHPLTGLPWMVYRYEASDYSAWVARYVGSGGNCDDTQGGSDAWDCEEIDDVGNTGQDPSIAFDESGTAWVAFKDATNTALIVANYVGSGGNCDTRGGSDAWQCTTVDATNDVGSDTAIVIDSSGNPWVSYIDQTNGNFEVAKYVGSGGNCDSVGAGSDAWQCYSVNVTNDFDYGTSIAIDPSDGVWASYYDNTNFNLEVAEYVGSGGNCDTFGGGSDAWECTEVDVTDNVGQSSSIAIDASGNPWISYWDGSSNTNLEVAQYVGSGGDCDTVGGGSDAWECTTVDVTDSVGQDSSIAFDPAGNAWVVYIDSTNTSLEYARYVGSGGNCDSVGGGSDSWQCSSIDNSSSITANALAFDDNGKAWIPFHDNTAGDLEIASLVRSGEILIAPSVKLSRGVRLGRSHADVTSASDSTNRDDGDCLATSTTWNQGVYVNTSFADGLTLPAGDSTQQCTEIGWTLDTSQATPGETYRFIVATKDSTRFGKGVWRGPIAVASDGYPTLTIASDAQSVYRYSKGIFAESGSDCSNTDWLCETIESGSNIGKTPSLAFDTEGTPWISYERETGGNGDLVVAKYVGSGNGSGCSSTAWECTTVVTANDAGTDSAISFDSSGTAWVAYRDVTAGSLKVAWYVGGGAGTGCADSNWSCETVESAGSPGSFAQIITAPNGKPWIFHENNSSNSVEVAKYVGNGNGTGCDSSDWTCEVIHDDSGTHGHFVSPAFSPDGVPWLSWRDASANEDLWVANYVGSGGDCSNPQWECTVVAATNSQAYQGANIGFNGAGTPVLVWHYLQSNDLIYGEYVGSGGDCDTTWGGSDAWNCTTVYTTDNTGIGPALAMDPNGNPWTVFRESTNSDLEMARYVGSGGTGCNDSTWTDCGVIDSTIDPDYNLRIGFDHDGIPWVAAYDQDNGGVKVARMKESPFAPTREIINSPYSSRDASTSELTYPLTAGVAPYTDPYGTCGGLADLMGYCGVYTADGQYDSITAGAYERPVYSFSTRYGSNSALPTAKVKFLSSVSPSTQNVVLQVYRYGSTNAWETVSTYSTAGCTGTDNCTISSLPSGTPSDYYESDSGEYWVHYRLYQESSSSGSTTLYLDSFTAHQPQQSLRGGRVFREENTDPLGW